MRVRTWSACVVLAWGILLILTAVGSSGFFRPAQANTRIASDTSNTIQVTLTTTLTSSPVAHPDLAAALAATTLSAPHPEARNRADTDTDIYLVRPGDTLSGIAAALGIPGGWPALYAANRAAIGPDPNAIRPGTTLTLPGRTAPDRYTVAPGDTLSGIAAALGAPGGWPTLYAANRRVIGPDPNAIRAGTVLAIPRPIPASPESRPGRRSSRSAATAPAPAPAKSPAPATSGHHPARAQARRSAQAQAPSVAGLPRWLEIVLVAAGLLIGLGVPDRAGAGARPPPTAGPLPGHGRRAHRAGRL